MGHSRRWFTHSLCGCALGLASNSVLARALPTELTSLVTPNYEPTDDDERGMWQVCERLERELAGSSLLIGDAGLKSYLTDVMTRLLGAELAADLRIYPVRDPEFNASMFPNGMMLVQSGLLLRMSNEAQLAAVLGHECGHYLRRHSVQNWRSARTKTALMTVVTLGGAFVGGNVAAAINTSLLSSIFSFGRGLESEADAFGLQLLRDAKYDVGAAAEVWMQLIDERKASAAARSTPYRDSARSSLSTHPPTAERMSELATSATAIKNQAGETQFDARRAPWQAAIAALRPAFLDDQIKLNDPGASLYLLNSLAREGWDGTLRHFEAEAYRLRGEPNDKQLAAQAYAKAVAYPDAPPEAFRGHGYAQLAAGNSEAGRLALSRYLELQPTAADAAMVRYTLQQ